MYPPNLAESAGLAAVAELAYRTPEGSIGFEPLVPLRLGERACFALTFDRSTLARALGRSQWAAIVLSDSRLALKGWRPLAASVRLDVFPDQSGDLFSSRLLEQELRKFPPARLLIDTPLMRREHWWYMPRWIVRVAEIDSLEAVVKRTKPNDCVAAWLEGDRVRADAVEVDDWDRDEITLRSLSDDDRLARAGGAAALMRHDFTIPELDEWAVYRVTGRLSGGRLAVEDRNGERSLQERLGLAARLRHRRRLKAACTRELAAYERG